MMYSDLTKAIRELFDSNDKVTLTMIYDTIEKQNGDDISSALKHSIRSIVHNMKKRGKIRAVSPSTYRKA